MGQLCSSSSSSSKPSSNADRYAANKSDSSSTIHDASSLHLPKLGVGKCIQTDSVLSVCNGFVSDALICAGDDKSIVMYDWRSDQVLHTWRGHTRCVNQVVCDRKSARIVSASRDKDIRIWCPDDEKSLATLCGHERTVQTVDLNAIGTLVSGSRDYSVRIWDMTKSQQIASKTIERNVVTSTVWFDGNNSSLFAQTGEDLTIRIWDSRSMEPVVHFPREQHFALDCDVHQDNHHIAASYNGFDGESCMVKVWDRRNPNQAVYELKGHEHAVRGCAFVHNSMEIVSGGKDGCIKWWNPLLEHEDCEVADTSFGNTRAITSVAVLDLDDETASSILAVGGESGIVSIIQCTGNSSPENSTLQLLRQTRTSDAVNSPPISDEYTNQ
jgi:WD40 repeat protein